MKLKKQHLYTILIALVAVILIGYVLFQISKARTFQLFGRLVDRVSTNEKVVALTFDDAPTEYTDEVLQVLKDKKVKATFYVIGNYLEKDPMSGKQIVLQGHELGNHSYSHERFLLKSSSFIDEEIQKTNKLIKEAGYSGTITFRPPNGKKLFALPWYLDQHGITTIMWDVEPDTYAADYEEGKEKTDFLVKNVLENTKPGSIILLHPFCQTCQSDRDTIAKIIDALQSKGYKFVTISELLKYQQQDK